MCVCVHVVCVFVCVLFCTHSSSHAYSIVEVQMRGGSKFCGRFAQARGSSAWARQFNFQASGAKFFGPSSFRTVSSINLAKCLGEVPLSGFAEQYSSITQSFNSMGQSSANSDTVAGDDDEIATNDEMMEFVQIAEVPTLFTYTVDNSQHRRIILHM